MTDVDDYWEPGDDREPDEPDWDVEEEARHSWEAHGGKACDCPLPSPEETEAAWAEHGRQHRAAVHGGGECDCTAPW